MTIAKSHTQSALNCRQNYLHNNLPTRLTNLCMIKIETFHSGLPSTGPSNLDSSTTRNCHSVVCHTHLLQHLHPLPVTSSSIQSQALCLVGSTHVTELLLVEHTQLSLSFSPTTSATTKTHTTDAPSHEIDFLVSHVHFPLPHRPHLQRLFHDTSRRCPD